MRGKFDRSSWTFTETDTGITDTGSLVCQQSLTDHSGFRVQMGWINVRGLGWSGAQSLPRTIAVSQKAQRLTFTPHPNVWSLHGIRVDVPAATVTPVTPMDLSAIVRSTGGGSRFHLRAELVIPIAREAASITIRVMGGHEHGGSSVTVSTTGAISQCSAGALVNNSDTTSEGYVGATPYTMDPSVSGAAGAKACQQLCCTVPGCVRFTYTDPQPGSNAHLCWLKGGYGELVPHSWPNGHAWSGLVGVQPPPPAPPPPCDTGTIVNNSDTTGDIIKTISMNESVSGKVGAMACQALCCGTAGCAQWTYTDPQPGSSAHDCWLKSAGGALVPDGSCKAGGGHCWSGELAKKAPPSFTRVPTPLALSVNGGPKMNITDYADAGLGNNGTVTALVDLFVDGSVLEVFANDGQSAVTATQSSATSTESSVTVTGDDIGVEIVVWEMMPSVE